MGNYISEGTLYTRIGTARLTALCKATGDEDAGAVLSGAIARAEAMVNSYAAVRYAVPLAATELPAEWALRIAEYELYKRSPADSIPQKIKDAYADVVKQLQALASGEIKVPSSSSGGSGGSSGTSSGGSSGSSGQNVLPSSLVSPFDTVNGGLQIYDASSMEGF